MLIQNPRGSRLRLNRYLGGATTPTFLGRCRTNNHRPAAGGRERHATASDGLVDQALAAGEIGAAIFEDYIDYKPAKRGAIESCTILGWHPESFDRSRLTETLGSGDKKQTDRLFAKDIVAYANLDFFAAAEHHDMFGDDYPDSLAGEIEDEVLDFIKSAKAVYTIQTSAGRSDFSWRFSTAVCWTIAEITSGLIEEPQLAEYFFAEEADQHFRRFTQRADNKRMRRSRRSRRS